MAIVRVRWTGMRSPFAIDQCGLTRPYSERGASGGPLRFIGKKTCVYHEDGQNRQNKPPLVMHVIHRLAVGGLENGLINLINYMPAKRYRHAIVSLTEHTDFRFRIRPNVPIVALHKRHGQDFGVHWRFWQALRQLEPDIVHTRNLPTLECQIPAALAGVRGRIHGEHGRDIYDLDGSSFKYNLLRRALKPLTHRYTAVSANLANWLVQTVGVRPDRVSHICNGVDTGRFYPRNCSRCFPGPEGFASEDTLVIGTVGRMQTVKDQPTLVRAFVQLLATVPNAREHLRLVMVGDGPLRDESQELLRAAGAEHLAWLPGEREDIPEIMRALDVFVLPSLAEGISNTILEAMASGLPVIATRVGGNPELVIEGHTGMLVPAAKPVAMAEAIRTYITEGGKLVRHGHAGRNRVETHFSIEAMVKGYLSVYDSVLQERRLKSGS